ncbi:MAG: DUF962 domain-containing protein [Planctomycetaceae bacterium]|nr:DUF962 domain-containing protein [Planctomycetales bacterium]MCB9921884.1 DUF962 domain-containing protein [Planctomycetaceae bacterium]
MSRKTPEEWFAEYSVCHQNRANKVIHWVCVPAIAASLIGMLWSIPFPWVTAPAALNWAAFVIALCMIFYIRLSLRLALGMAVWASAVLGAIIGYESMTGGTVLVPSVIVFVAAWFGQFVGHKLEGKRPAFFQDLQFLLIGPAWVLDAFYRRIGIRR